jgi:hypothetical protein
MHDIQDYVTADGRDPFKDWVASLLLLTAWLAHDYWRESSEWQPATLETASLSMVVCGR